MQERHIIYLLLAVLIAIPYLRPLGIPVATNKMTLDFYNTLQSLPPGSTVVLMMDVGLGSWIEQGPATVAVLQHLFNLPIKLLVSGFSNQLNVYWDYILQEGKLDLKNKKYGEDYVILGFVTGGESGSAALASDLFTTKQDRYGTPLTDLPIMQNLKTAKDVNVVITVMAGTEEEWYLRQWQAPYDTKVGAVISGVTTPLAMTYYVSGQMFGMVSSLRGGAEYELLVQKPGKGVVGTDMLSMALLFEVILIIAGNGLMFYKGKENKEEVKPVG
jgi:hypothetical protein